MTPIEQPSLNAATVEAILRAFSECRHRIEEVFHQLLAEIDDLNERMMHLEDAVWPPPDEGPHFGRARPRRCR